METIPNIQNDPELEKYVVKVASLETSLAKLESLRSQIYNASKQVILACRAGGEKLNPTVVSEARNAYEVALALYEKELDSLMGKSVIH